ncbi:aminotransferase class I/II-fold pyridoxal phosphate-dependent enzyme [Rubellimicrobium sp. CFH 75288]|uniref:aminotransferase class I/II-fold pyridoxal phosphate-dependent enzyme n=1 Tax=Rubellimicrobium sp. CFH 75288 TaxID=2697034 RepID=UPI001411CB00|nr:aminotransferase class I/II-fold pyridoxal phosphate-dependent enzyme [Rubellimicrobium sp. CFH 75288]NAZ37390.1 aminotransferase class I/II-fold pyridoxal phosphate-dependent enzyme [Rubellimicrobium sp. CFH 75288]
MRDHGGGLDAAIAAWGGARGDWLDLSTGINPVPYPLPPLPPWAWTALPDRDAARALEEAARAFWSVPPEAEIVAAPGLSALIARLPHLLRLPAVAIPGPTYNEWEAAFRAAGTAIADDPSAPLCAVHPNNPDGRPVPPEALEGRPLALLDESFCDPTPEASHMPRTADGRTVVLKSFGKFWGLAGLRLGFAILPPGPLAGALREALGPWPVSGPALAVGAAALADRAWAETTRTRLRRDAARLDALMGGRGARLAGGTDLFRLYDVGDARAFAAACARARVLVRVFPWSPSLVRLGLPPPGEWDRLAAALP